ncbi:MAG: sugar ABC transporter permease [Clostridia bacterium]|nr:sugar ABC transporter permease [Clostridia bacterium]
MSLKKFDRWKGWLYLSPAIVLLLIFTGWPIVNTIRMAFLNDYSTMAAVGGATFQFGIKNFVKVIQYRGFITCLKNTMLLCVLTVPISTLLALIIAVCLNSIKFLNRFLQTIFFLPYVTNSIAIGMVFAAMFNIVGSFHGTENQIIETAGIINNVLGVFGVEPINWINAGSEYWANITVMVIYIVWNALPFKILILLGGLQSVNKQYYEAAKIDSTPRVRVFTRITVPLLSPMITYVVITGFIGGFKEYSSIVGIFGDTMGPPGDKGRLNTMVGYIYDALAQASGQGRASAAALILFGIIFVVTMINLAISKKNTHY